ncbi:MAG: HepT-like ribonuclease domain-containing protein [Rhodospirillaceae bacterium]|nr:HepT-like ribonuclease domain-containing protein [Rhodospirillaceae bacterium]
MAKDVTIRLAHMLESIGWIMEDADGLSVDALSTDRRLKQLIERNLEIISEASRHIPPELKARYPEIPWREIAGIGNVLRHNYQDIAPKVMIDLIRHDLPPLNDALEELLAELGTRKN